MLQEEILRGREVYASMRRSLMKHLDAKYPGRQYRIFRVEHRMPTPVQYFGEGWSLDDPRLYVELSETWQPPEEAFPIGPYPQPPIPYRLPPEYPAGAGER